MSETRSMIPVTSSQNNSSDTTSTPPAKLRLAVRGEQPEIFTDIHREEVIIVIWQREISAALQHSAKVLLASRPGFQTEITVTPQNALSNIKKSLGTADQTELSEDIAQLTDIFCRLFHLDRAGLRLMALDKTMCPKFHADRVPCRLLTTYQGIATEWLPHHLMNHSKLGSGSNGEPDHKSGLFENSVHIKQLSCGEVALLKGERWKNNKNAGLVHRSPKLSLGESRLLLRLDFIK